MTADEPDPHQHESERRMTDQTQTERGDAKGVDVNYATLDELTDKQLLWNIYTRLRAIQFLVAILVLVTILAVGVSAWLIVSAVNDANSTGF